MVQLARLVTPGLVSTVVGVLGLVLVVVAVAGSPAPWWAAVFVAAAELLAVSYGVHRNAAATEVRPARKLKAAA
jgi:hypothetical protein